MCARWALHATPQRLYVGSLFQIWRLENVLAPHERANENFDRLYVPRNAQTTGDIDVHELARRQGRAGDLRQHQVQLPRDDEHHPRLQAAVEAALHLPARRRGPLPPERPRHAGRRARPIVTAVSRSDMINGWRDRRHEGGVLIDVRDDRIVTDQLSMPHSPRVARRRRLSARFRARHAGAGRSEERRADRHRLLPRLPARPRASTTAMRSPPSRCRATAPFPGSRCRTN